MLNSIYAIPRWTLETSLKSVQFTNQQLLLLTVAAQQASLSVKFPHEGCGPCVVWPVGEAVLFGGVVGPGVVTRPAKE